MKLCPRCKTRPSRRVSNKDTYPYCVECFAEYNTERRIERKAIIDKAKDVPCVDCGIRYPSYVMDFDHLRDKVVNISRMGSSSIQRILAEIEKCEVVCANCHRERTNSRGLA